MISKVYRLWLEAYSSVWLGTIHLISRESLSQLQASPHCTLWQYATLWSCPDRLLEICAISARKNRYWLPCWTEWWMGQVQYKHMSLTGIQSVCQSLQDDLFWFLQEGALLTSWLGEARWWSTQSLACIASKTTLQADSHVQRLLHRTWRTSAKRRRHSQPRAHQPRTQHCHQIVSTMNSILLHFLHLSLSIVTNKSQVGGSQNLVPYRFALTSHRALEFDRETSNVCSTCPLVYRMARLNCDILQRLGQQTSRRHRGASFGFNAGKSTKHQIKLD